jgi:copper chaperone NosL
MRRAPTLLLVTLLSLGCVGDAEKPEVSVSPGEIQPVPIEEGDRCPECGMYVKPYENWACEVFLKTGKVEKFDDPGDMFIYYSKHKDEVVKIFVKDYYTQEWIDGEKAFYVTRARIPTPMGFGIVPFLTRDKAEAFKKDYTAGEILSFEELALHIKVIAAEKGIVIK